MAVNGHERLDEELENANSLPRVAMWALVSIAQSLKRVADSLPWEVKRVGDVVVGRTKEA